MKLGGLNTARPICIVGRAFARQAHIRTPQGGVYADQLLGYFFDVVHGSDSRWAFRSHLSTIHGVATFISQILARCNNSCYDKKDVCAASYSGTTQDDSTKAAAATLARDKATPSPSTRVEPPVIPALQQTYSWGSGFRNATLSK